MVQVDTCHLEMPRHDSLPPVACVKLLSDTANSVSDLLVEFADNHKPETARSRGV